LKGVSLGDGSAPCKLLAAKGFSVQTFGVHLGWPNRTFPCYPPHSGGEADLRLAARLLNVFFSVSSPPDLENQGDVTIMCGAGGSLSLQIKNKTPESNG